MKLNIKKIYCRSCHRLVKGREQKLENGSMRLECMKCGNPIYLWTGISWKPL